jgi:quercetin dioxygenase-like cupin family protein
MSHSKLESIDHPVTNEPYKSAGEDYVIMNVEGGLTDARFVFHATGERTGGSCGLFEVSFAPNDASPHHIHHLEDEGFYVLEGQLTLHGDNEELVLNKGEFGWGPRGVRHAYSAGPEGARALCFQIPGTGLHNWFRIMAAAQHNPFIEEGDEERWARWSYDNFRVTQLPTAEFPPGQTIRDAAAATS